MNIEKFEDVKAWQIANTKYQIIYKIQIPNKFR